MVQRKAGNCCNAAAGASSDMMISSGSATAILSLPHTMNKMTDFVQNYKNQELKHVHLHVSLMDMPISLMLL